MRRFLLVLLIVVVVGAGIVVIRDRSRTQAAFSCSLPQRNESPAPVTVGEPIGTAMFELVASVDGALAMEFHPSSGAMYVATKQGTVEHVVDGSTTVVVDLTGEVAKGFEQGLLGMAFHPSGNHMYLNYTDTRDDTRVIEFAVDQDGTPLVETRRDVLLVEQPAITHNGGHLAFGPEGYLWIGFGDGGGEPNGGPKTGFSENAQDLGSLLGSLSRIDPRPSGEAAYSIPPDNPYVGVAGAREEIWMIGLRNPWRFGFDSETGDLWIGDVGQFCWEEINFIAAGQDRLPAENLGWPMVEGPDEWRGGDVDGVMWAAYDLAHADGERSVVGGVVYRGHDLPELQGWYIFTDSYVGNIRAMRISDDGGVDVRSFTVDRSQAVSFTEGPDGEIYVISFGEGVSKLVAVAPSG
jgi:glucose/arabinose dehydrogenase